MKWDGLRNIKLSIYETMYTFQVRNKVCSRSLAFTACVECCTENDGFFFKKLPIVSATQRFPPVNVDKNDF